MENNKKTKEYWEKRARENENKVYAKGSEVKKALEEHYLKARKEIRKSVSELVARYMDKTELSYIEAVTYLTSSEFKEWRMTLEEYEEEIKRLEKISPEFARKLRIELETLATKSRITRLESLNTQIDMELAKKSIKDYDVIRDSVSKTYSDFFKIQTTEFGLDGANTVLPKKTIEMLMQQPWSGANFSERIWGNTEALARVLKQEIIQAFMQGVSVKDLSDRIEKRFENDRYNTERLVRTELNYALNQSTKLSYDEAGIKEYEFLAEIDSRTSDICRELNGQRFKMKDAKTGVNYPPMHPHCYDKETEIYTNQGWKYFKDLDKTEMVYTINPETLNVEWQKPINYISYKHQGKVLHYKNTRFNLMVTPQHKLLIQNMDNSVKDKSWKLKEAIEVGRKSKNRMLSGINWLGKKKEFETLAGKEIDIELYLKFMAYWLADGSCTKDRGSYNIKIAQCENDWMYEELKEIPFKIYKCKESLIIHNKELGKELSRFGKCTEKYIPENIKELNPELIRIFLMAYAKTDGHIRKGKNWKGYQFNDSIVFFTTSDKMASDLGELILKAGGRPSYYLNKIQGKEIEFKNGKYTINKDCWVISWNTQIHTWISSLNIDEIEYNDNVYCVEVPKYNTVLVRRKGKICWSGNCRSTTIPVMNYEDIKTRKTKPKSEDDKKKEKTEPIKNDIMGLDKELYPDELANVKRGKIMTRKEANEQKGNPKIKLYLEGRKTRDRRLTAEYQPYTTNCQTCVVTFEARLRGYDVEALPNIKNETIRKLSRKTNLAWIDPKTGKNPIYIKDDTVTTPKKYFKFLQEVIKEKERYTIEFTWKGSGNSGHIISLDRDDDGKLRFYDPQIGRSYNEAQIQEYLKNLKYVTTVYGTKIPTVPKILRVDDKYFDKEVVDKILKGADKE